jgi:hypothetical protein
MAKRIVVWDGQDARRVGTVIEASQHDANNEAKGLIATLPVDDRVLELGPVHGYFRRDWGMPGIAWRSMLPTQGAPMLIWVTPEIPYVHFAVRVHADPTQPRPPRGVLRLAPGHNATGAFTGGIGAVGGTDIHLDDLARDLSREERNEAAWVLRGRARLNVQLDGYLSCCIGGVAEGIRVVWSAITQSSQEG